jgi:hypothetical protein
MLCLQVVVDTAEAGKALLARGKLRSRVTLIPLDKVRVLPCPLQAAAYRWVQPPCPARCAPLPAAACQIIIAVGYGMMIATPKFTYPSLIRDLPT